jgi:Short C-terminal domain
MTLPTCYFLVYRPMSSRIRDPCLAEGGGGTLDRDKRPSDARCPACGQMLHVGNRDECPSCGLYLGDESPPSDSWLATLPMSDGLNVTIDDSDLDVASPVSICDFVYLGGAGTGLRRGSEYTLLAGPQTLSVHRPERVLDPSDAEWAVTYREIIGITLGGPGREAHSANLVGGGVGMEGAVEGMALAALVNQLSARTIVTTHLGIECWRSEAFLLNTRYSPQELRMLLSPAMVAIRSDDGAKASPVNSSIAELERLAALRSAGALTDEEFEQLKRTIVFG